MPSRIFSEQCHAQCCQTYDNYRICTIIWPSVRCTINNSKNAQMYDNFGISSKRVWIHYFPWLLIWDLVWLLKISQEISQSDPRSVLGGIKNTGCIFPDQFQAFICVSSKKLPASTQHIWCVFVTQESKTRSFLTLKTHFLVKLRFYASDFSFLAVYDSFMSNTIILSLRYDNSTFPIW